MLSNIAFYFPETIILQIIYITQIILLLYRQSYITYINYRIISYFMT